MSIKTQGIFVSVVMLIAAIWGADTILPIVTIVLSLAGTIYAQLVAEASKAHDRPVAGDSVNWTQAPDGTRSVNWTAEPLWKRISKRIL